MAFPRTKSVRKSFPQRGFRNVSGSSGWNTRSRLLAPAAVASIDGAGVVTWNSTSDSPAVASVDPVTGVATWNDPVAATDTNSHSLVGGEGSDLIGGEGNDLIGGE